MQQKQNTADSLRKGPMPIMMHLALMALSPDDMKDILQGLHNYHHHTYNRDDELPPLETVWQLDQVQLKRAASADVAAKNCSNPLLIIPSFINGPEILDLTKERSLLRWLNENGIECYLLDWGNLTLDSCGHSFSELVTERLTPALEFIIDTTKKKPTVMGYCLGGNFATALTTLNNDHISKLVLLATPWNFHHEDNKLKPLLLDAERKVKKRAETNGYLTTDFMQSLFIQTDLKQSAKKFANFGRHDPNSKDAKHFVATEDWVNSGQPIPAKLVAECIDTFYRKNATYKDCWMLKNNIRVDVKTIKAKTLIISPKHDHIVPHASSSAITGSLSNASQLNVDSGHIGMLVGRKAKEICWNPLLDFLNQ